MDQKRSQLAELLHSTNKFHVSQLHCCLIKNVCCTHLEMERWKRNQRNHHPKAMVQPMDPWLKLELPLPAQKTSCEKQVSSPRDRPSKRANLPPSFSTIFSSTPMQFFATHESVEGKAREEDEMRTQFAAKTAPCTKLTSPSDPDSSLWSSAKHVSINVNISNNGSANQ